MTELQGCGTRRPNLRGKNGTNSKITNLVGTRGERALLARRTRRRKKGKGKKVGNEKAVCVKVPPAARDVPSRKKNKMRKGREKKGGLAAKRGGNGKGTLVGGQSGTRFGGRAAS